MFKFLKDKLKSAISKLSKKAEEDAVEETEEKIEERKEEIKELEEEKEELKKDEEKIEKEIEEKKEEVEGKEEVIEEPAEEKEKIKELEKKKQEIKNEEKEVEVEKKKKKGFLSKLAEKITTARISDSNFENLFWDLEVVLLENNVAVEVIEKIKKDLKKNIVDNPIQRGKVEKVITDSLKNSIRDVLSVKKIDLIKEIKEKKEKPYVLCFIGVNGSGKTTTIAKVANRLKKNGVSCIIAAADTFRAAAIDQMQLHADKLDIKMIKHDYGADAAAVSFDAVNHAKAKGKDVVLIDTAGRMHSNSNLMDEMKKIVKVAKPDLNVFVGESIVGNDCIEQAKKFDESVGIDAIILSKADVDEKGGASISISYVTKKPIMFIGTGQEYDDLNAFEPEAVLENLGL